MRKKIWIVLLIVLIVALAAIGIAWRINAQKKADTAVYPFCVAFRHGPSAGDSGDDPDSGTHI